MSAEQWQMSPGEVLEAATIVGRQVEELKQLGEELRVRQGRLGELLAPSEAALKARTEYLDRTIREQLRGVEQHATRLMDEVRQSSEGARQMLLATAEALRESDRQRTYEAMRQSRRRVLWSAAALFLGGALAGVGASWASRTVPPDATSSASVVERAEVSAPAAAPARKPAAKPRPRASVAPEGEPGS